MHKEPLTLVQKRKLYKAGWYLMKVPPVPTNLWDEEHWFGWIGETGWRPFRVLARAPWDGKEFSYLYCTREAAEKKVEEVRAQFGSTFEVYLESLEDL